MSWKTIRMILRNQNSIQLFHLNRCELEIKNIQGWAQYNVFKLYCVYFWNTRIHVLEKKYNVLYCIVQICICIFHVLYCVVFFRFSPAGIFFKSLILPLLKKMPACGNQKMSTRFSKHFDRLIFDCWSDQNWLH